MRSLSLRRALLALFVFFCACAEAIPEKPGAWVLTGRTWTPLAAVDTAGLQKPLPRRLESLRAVVPVNRTPRPRIVFVGRAPAEPLSLSWRGSEREWHTRALTAIPHERREGVWELAWREAAPQGLLLLRSGATGMAVQNGADARLSLARGLAEEKAGDLQAAEAALREAVEASQNLAPPRARLALFLATHRRDLSTARRVVEEAIALATDPRERARYHAVLAEVCLAEGDGAAGMAALDRAMELDPATKRQRMAALNRLIDAVQAQPPADVLRAFYTALSREAWGDAAELSRRPDVERLKDAQRLVETFASLAPRRSMQAVDILREQREGKVAYYEYTFTAADGSRRKSALGLHFIDNVWKVGLE